MIICDYLFDKDTPCGKVSTRNNQEGLKVNINNEVVNELNALKDCGVSIKSNVFKKTQQEDMDQYISMSVSDIADLMINLYN